MTNSTEHNQTRTRSRRRTSLLARGETMVWLTGGALVVCIAMIVGLLTLIAAQGASTFWPRKLVQIEMPDGVYLGEVTRHDEFLLTDSQVEALPERVAETARARMQAGQIKAGRRLLRTGNYDVTNSHFHWVNDMEVVRETNPEWAIIAERLAWGIFIGTPQEFRIDGATVAEGPEATWNAFQQHHDDLSKRHEKIVDIQKHDFGRLYAKQEKARLALLGAELEHGSGSDAVRAATAELERITAETESKKQQLSDRIRSLTQENERFALVMTTAQGQSATLKPGEIVRAYPANQIGLGGKLAVYASRWKEFLTADPRQANSEGGVWPAIVGTVIMTLLMSIAVVPFGVLAALYLREYAKKGAMVSIVRISVNNLAGVPSIVFGVFGLGFFCYIMGASIDQLFFAAKLPNPTFGKGGVLWASLTLALLTLPVVIVATEEALSAVPDSMRAGSYACGASKWQTIRRIVLPRAMPGIMTGLILAMARGAGEVAPLMLVGAAKLAPELPIDGVFPFLHAERSFMHLGFHIYDVGFQSQNSEAAKPMVYTTTLLLITIIATLNVAAIWIRGRLRRRFVGSKF